MKWATLSDCGCYRFDLGRPLRAGARILTMCLCNPSTADASIDDPTVRRGLGYASDWGFDTLVYVNSNPYRSTDPETQISPPSAILALNDRFLEGWGMQSELVIAAWGTKALTPLAQRAEFVLRKVAPLHALKVTKGGAPGHPLYLKADLTPIAFPAR